MAKVARNDRKGTAPGGRSYGIPDGLLEQLLDAASRDIRPDRVERGRRHERYRTFDNRDVVRQVATELLRVSAAL